MVYSYDDVVNKANETGLSGQFTQSDWDVAQKSPAYGMAILQLMQDAAGADTEEKRLLSNNMLNAVRNSFGTTTTGGGESASMVRDLLGQIDGYGSFAYSNEEEYRRLLEQAMNPEKFSYDPESDSSYAALSKAYRREGDRAVQDTLAKVAAATGGVPSSYAITAAQQAGNYYASQLADRLPEMEQNAYQKYLDQNIQNQNLLSLLQSDRQNKQADWQNGLNQLQGKLNNWLTQAATEYSQGMNAIDMANQFREDAELRDQQNKQNQWTQEEMDRTDDQQKFTNALALWGTLGYATPEIAQILGIPEGTKPAAPEVEPTTELSEVAKKLFDLGLDAVNAEYIAATYPDGVITDSEDWDILLGTGLSEKQLNRLGYKLPVLDYNSAVSLLGGTAGKRDDVVSALIDEGILETYIEGGSLKVKKGANWSKCATYLLSEFGINISGGHSTRLQSGGGPKMNNTTNVIKLD